MKLSSCFRISTLCLKSQSLGSKIIIQVRWEKPSLGWVHLNTDVLALGNPGPVGCGGIIRNEHGDWLRGFSRSIGITSSFIAELWALQDGLNMCLNMHFLAVDVQIDARLIVEAVCNSSYANRVFMPIVVILHMLIELLYLLLMTAGS